MADSSKKAPPGMLSRGLAILVELGRHPDGLALTELAKLVGLPVSTTHRLLTDLAELGFATVDQETKRYSVGLRVLELAQGVALGKTVGKTAAEPMADLTVETEETTILSMIDGTEIVYIQRVDPNRAVRISAYVGQRGPAFCTSTGKVLLAEMPAERRQAILALTDYERYAPNTTTDPEAVREEIEEAAKNGYAFVDGEYDPDIRAIAVPVKGPDGSCIAALCIAAPAFRASRAKLRQLLPRLRHTSETITASLSPRG
jgi:IclR family acetate operon transcriptional repressor